MFELLNKFIDAAKSKKIWEILLTIALAGLLLYWVASWLDDRYVSVKEFAELTKVVDDHNKAADRISGVQDRWIKSLGLANKDLLEVEIIRLGADQKRLKQLQQSGQATPSQLTELATVERKLEELTRFFNDIVKEITG